MQNSSFNEDLIFNDQRVSTKVILESSFSKEIRILLKKGQIMKEHQTPFPIVVHLLEGELTFGVQGVNHDLKKGDILSLEGSIPHDLTAKTDSIVRLTLSKMDKAERVDAVAENSAK
jgi:quercetin dioxygenase-like cupin family protein